MMNNYRTLMSRSQRIHDVLSSELKPESLTIEDESHRHNVPKGAETHFKVTAVSFVFEDLGRVARHRMINNLLAHEFDAGLHALSLHLFTPHEWLEKKNAVPSSPACRDGRRHD